MGFLFSQDLTVYYILLLTTFVGIQEYSSLLLSERDVSKIM